MGKKLLKYHLICLVLLAMMGFVDCQASVDDCCCECEPAFHRHENPTYNELLFKLQQYWAGQKIYAGQPNGLFDQRMEEAVLGFQRMHGLKATGVLDEGTWQVIGDLAVGRSVEKLPEGNLEILVDMDSLTLTILVNRQPYRRFPVAIGKTNTPSPIGAWKIRNKGYWVKGETRWLGLSVPYGVYGIHGTNQPWSIGRRASKGCIRMYNHHLESVYRWARVNTPVYIVGDPFRDHRVMKRGLIGADIFHLQIRLKQLGYFKGKPNGIFDPRTVAATKKWQKEHGFKVTGEIGGADYYRLRLYPTD